MLVRDVPHQPFAMSFDRYDATAAGGYGSSMSGVGRTIMPLLFFVFSFFTNAASSGAPFLRNRAEPSLRRPADSWLVSPSALIMWRVLRTYHRDDDCEDADWKTRAKINLVRYRPVFEAILQSAAVYSTASLVLIVTFLTSPNVAYYTSLSIFSPLMVSLSLPLSFINVQMLMGRLRTRRAWYSRSSCCGLGGARTRQTLRTSSYRRRFRVIGNRFARAQSTCPRRIERVRNRLTCS